MIEKVDARPPEGQLVTAQFRIRGARHRRELGGLIQVGAAGEITLPVLRLQVIACLDETLGEERLSRARDMRFPDWQHLEDIPVLTPGQFKTLCESLGLGEIAKEVKEMRLSGSCGQSCRQSYNPDPWGAGRRKKRLEKSAGGQLTITSDGRIKGGVVYVRPGKPLPREFVFVKARNAETGEVEIVAVVKKETPSPSSRVPRHQRPKPQPTEADAQKSLTEDGCLMEDTIPF